MITAIILTKNEEQNIEECLKSISFCDEVLVIDDNSKDKTVSIAKNNKARVVVRGLNNDFAAQRNFALDMIQEGWALFIDADETISESLRQEIILAVKNTQIKGYYLKREDELFGKKITHGELLHKKFLRLGQVGAGTWRGKVHEEWIVKGAYETLDHPLIHKPHQSVSEFLSEINLYSTIRAHELRAFGTKSSLLAITGYTFGKFLILYFVKLGFLDGVAGIIMSLMMSLYTFLVRGKLYLLQNKK